MSDALPELLRTKKTKLSGVEAVQVSLSLALFMKRKRFSKSWNTAKLSETLGVSDVRFIQRLIRLGEWPRSVHKFILKNEKIDFPFLRSFLDESWSRSDTLIAALQRKLADEKPRKKNNPAIFSEFEKIRRVHIKTLSYTDKLKEEVKSLKDQVKQLEQQEDVDRLHWEIKMLKDTLKGYLTNGPADKTLAAPQVSADQQYIIDTIRGRFGGVRTTLNSKTRIILLECLSEDGFDRIIDKLMN